MLNKVILMGRFTRDPELRSTPQGVSTCSFSIAVDRNFARQGEERKADFINCVAWRQTGEFVSKHFTRGRMAVVSGRLQMRSWTDKDGNKRRTAEIIADNVYFGDSKKDGEDAASSAPKTTAAAPVYSAPAATNDSDDSGLPF